MFLLKLFNYEWHKYSSYVCPLWLLFDFLHCFFLPFLPFFPFFCFVTPSPPHFPLSFPLHEFTTVTGSVTGVVGSATGTGTTTGTGSVTGAGIGLAGAEGTGSSTGACVVPATGGSIGAGSSTGAGVVPTTGVAVGVESSTGTGVVTVTGDSVGVVGSAIGADDDTGTDTGVTGAPSTLLIHAPLESSPTQLPVNRLEQSKILSKTVSEMAVTVQLVQVSVSSMGLLGLTTIKHVQVSIVPGPVVSHSTTAKLSVPSVMAVPSAAT